MGKIGYILKMLCAAVTLSVLLLLVWLAAAGRLTPENKAVLGRMLRGRELFVPEEPEAPTTQPAEEPEPEMPAEEELRLTDRAVELANRRIDRRMAELRYQEKQLQAVRRQIEQERLALRRSRENWAEEIRLRQERDSDPAFQQQVKLFSTMSGKQVKDLFMDMDEQLAARYLAAMKPQVAADVASRFKTETEQDKLRKLLELMRQDS